MMKQALASAGALALAGCATLPAANDMADRSYAPDCAAIGSFLDSAVAQGRTVGASALVWKDGREVCFDSAGLASREDERPFARDTLVQIFSMTKPVTGIALMQLWEQGKFGLDDPLYWHLPEYKDLKVATGLGPDGQPVLRDPLRPPTVRDVLRHTAGFTYGGSEEPADVVWAQLQPLSPDNTLAQFSQKMAQVPLLADPGTRWIYSASVDVQARLVEVLSGMAFDDYVAANIFTPLAMTDSAWKRESGDLHSRLGPRLEDDSDHPKRATDPVELQAFIQPGSERYLANRVRQPGDIANAGQHGLEFITLQVETLEQGLGEFAGFDLGLAVRLVGAVGLQDLIPALIELAPDRLERLVLAPGGESRQLQRCGPRPPGDGFYRRSFVCLVCAHLFTTQNDKLRLRINHPAQVSKVQGQAPEALMSPVLLVNMLRLSLPKLTLFTR